MLERRWHINIHFIEVDHHRFILAMELEFLQLSVLASHNTYHYFDILLIFYYIKNYFSPFLYYLLPFGLILCMHLKEKKKINVIKRIFIFSSSFVRVHILGRDNEGDYCLDDVWTMVSWVGVVWDFVARLASGGNRTHALTKERITDC